MTRRTPAELRAFADNEVWEALKAMEAYGVPFEMMMDRLLTNASAHILRNDGAERTAATFRSMADQIEAGVLAKIEQTSPSH